MTTWKTHKCNSCDYYFTGSDIKSQKNQAKTLKSDSPTLK